MRSVEQPAVFHRRRRCIEDWSSNHSCLIRDSDGCISAGFVKRVWRLPSGVARPLLLAKQLNHAFEIGISGAKTARKPVSAALGNPLAVGEDIELTGFSRLWNGYDVQVFLDEGHETRDFDPVVVSRRTMNDFDLH